MYGGYSKRWARDPDRTQFTMATYVHTHERRVRPRWLVRQSDGKTQQVDEVKRETEGNPSTLSHYSSILHVFTNGKYAPSPTCVYLFPYVNCVSCPHLMYLCARGILCVCVFLVHTDSNLFWKSMFCPSTGSEC